MKINIKRECVDELEILPCPCCSGNDVHATAFQGGIYQDGKSSAWVVCRSCKHKVEVESYSESKESLLRTAIARWNSQSKSYGKETKTNEEIKKRDELIKQLSDALWWYAGKPLHCIDKGKHCGLCTEFDTCSYCRNRLLIDKAKTIVKGIL
ncbi:MAG: hypothetical protein MJZ81_11475 [Bacteroidales bacterium]|nr:hypothetical protein [Bacteroidales bacterium]